MNWPGPLIEGIILKRYKRFLADVQINDEIITCHVPNTGSMTSCWLPQWKCAVSLSPNPQRKLPYTLELSHNGESWIGVNTANANKIAKLSLEQNLIEELKGYVHIHPEKKIGDSRIDFFLEGHAHLPDCYVEVKSVTLKLSGKAQFPDAVSLRGQKHLEELIKIKKTGLRAVMLYMIQREDIQSFAPCSSIDPVYTQLLSKAHKMGVEILAYQCKMTLEEISLGRSIPIEIN